MVPVDQVINSGSIWVISRLVLAPFLGIPVGIVGCCARGCGSVAGHHNTQIIVLVLWEGWLE